MEGVISLIVTGVVAFIIIVCTLLGIAKGFKRSLVDGIVNIVIAIALIFCTKVFANLVLNFDLSSFNFTVDGEQVTSLNQLIVNFLESNQALTDILGTGETAKEIITQLPIMLISPVVFTILFWLIKLVAFIISLLISLVMLIIRPFTKKSKAKQKTIIVKSPDGKEIVTNKPVKEKTKKKRRLLGGLVGIVSGLVIVFATFMPVFGLGNIFLKLNSVKVDENGNPVTQNTLTLYADENTQTQNTLLNEIFGVDCSKYVNAYNNCIGVNIARFSGMESLGSLTFNSLAQGEINNTKIKLVDEVNNVVWVYNDFLILSGELSKQTLTKEEMTKILNTTDNMVNNLFKINTLNAIGNYVLPRVIDGILNDPNYSIKLPEEITEDEVINLITTSVLNSLKEDDIANIKNILLEVVSTLKLLNDNNILAPIYNSINTNQELTTSDYVTLLQSTNDEFAETIADKLTDNNLVKEISPSLLDGGLDALFTFLDLNYTTNNITKDKSVNIINILLINLIDGIKTLDTTSELYLTTNTFTNLGKILNLTKDTEVLTTSQYNDLVSSVQTLLNNVELPLNIDSAIANLNQVTNWEDEMTKFGVAFEDFKTIYSDIKNKNQLDITKLNLTNYGKLFDDLEKTTTFNGAVKDTYNEVLNTTKTATGMATFSGVFDKLKITETNINWEKELTAIKPLLNEILSIKSLELTDARSTLELLDIVAKFDSIEQDTNSVIYSAKMQSLLIEVLNSAKQIANNQTITDLVQKVNVRINNRDTQKAETLETCVIKGIFDYATTLIPDSTSFDNENISSMILEIKANIIKANNGQIDNFNYKTELEYLLDFADNIDTLQNFNNLSSEQIEALSNTLDLLNESKILGNCKTHIINFAFDLAISSITNDDLKIVNELNKLKASLTTISIKILIDDMNIVKDNVADLAGVTDNITTMDTLEVANALETIRNTETFTDSFTNNIVKNLLSNVNETAQANTMLPQSKKTEIQEYVTTNLSSLENNETTSTTYKTILDGLKNLFSV